jgi:hypothetical protein
MNIVSISRDPSQFLLTSYSLQSSSLYTITVKVYINDISEIGLDSETLPKEMLQIEELDWCGFLTKEEAKTKIFYRVEHLLNLID